MAQQMITVLSELPTFNGNPRPEELGSFVPGTDERSFFRNLDGYFGRLVITRDEAKIRILFAKISCTSGDAILLANCFAGNFATYNQIQQTNIDAYPSLEQSDFRMAAKSLLKNDVNVPNFFCGVTALENRTRMVVNSFINSPHMTELNFGMNTDVLLAEDLEEGNHTTIPLRDVIQNFCMHLMLADQLQRPVYEKLANLGPNSQATHLMNKKE